MPTEGYMRLPDRGVIALRGPDTIPFLQNLISIDVERVQPDQAGYGALLTPQGKYLFDFLIAAHDDALLLETEAERLDPLLKRLTMYRLRAKVELTDASDTFAAVALIGDDILSRLGLGDHPGAARALDGGLIFTDPRLPALGARALLPATSADQLLGSLDLAPLEPEAYDRHRLALGVPDGSRDLVIERATLLESGFEELKGVDFDKGCFVGQELTARMKYRGLVRKRLLPVELDGAPPAPGTPVLAGDHDVGELRSSINGLGLALLRLARVEQADQDSVPLLAGETRLRPFRPDWMKI